MDDQASRDRHPAAVLSELGCPRGPALEYCDTLLAQCFDAMPYGVKVMNAAAKVVFYNRAAYEYFGPRIVWARLPHERDHLFHPDDLPARCAARERVLRDGLSVRVPVRAIRYDYTMHWYTFDLTPLFDKASMVTGALVRMSEMPDPDRCAAATGPVQGFW
jgi:hypothetical protein